MHDLMLLVLTEDANLVQMCQERLKGAGAADPLVQQAATLHELTDRLAEQDWQASLVDLRSPTAFRDASWLAGFAMVLAWSPTVLAPHQHAELEQAGVHAVLSPQIDGDELYRFLLTLAALERPDPSQPESEATYPAEDEATASEPASSPAAPSLSPPVPHPPSQTRGIPGRRISRRAVLRVVTGVGAAGLLSWLLVPQHQATLVSLATRPTRGPSPGATSAGPTIPVSAPTRPPGGPSPTAKPQPTGAPPPTDTPPPPTATPLPPGQTLLTYRGHTGVVDSVAWSPDGTRIASASDDTTVQVWDATTGKLLLTYSGHPDYVLAVAWSPDGKQIASAGNDGTVQVWDATTGKRAFLF